jgi:hypothetical protein
MNRTHSILESLKKRLDLRGNLLVQHENGSLIEVTFSFNPPAQTEKIDLITKKRGWTIPEDFKQFLLLHDGGNLFKDSQYGIFGYQLLSIEEILTYHLDHVPPDYMPIVNSYGDGDLLFINSSRVKEGRKDYLFYLDGLTMRELGINFDEWLDRLVICQGVKYWLWPYYPVS